MTTKHSKPMKYVDVHMSGFPSHDAPFFIETENERGESVGFGEWIKREDGAHVLRFQLVNTELLAALKELVRCWGCDTNGAWYTYAAKDAHAAIAKAEGNANA